MSPDANTHEAITVQTPVGRLHVQLIGAGPPAVLWHSLFVDSSTWCRVRDTLAEHRQLIIIDGPSHGQSEPVTVEFTESDCATAAVAVLDHLALSESVDWVGNAWGGHVGIAFAATEPGRCRSLIAIGTPVRALSGPERRKIALLSAIYRAVGPVPPLVRILREALLGKDADPQAYQIVGRRVSARRPKRNVNGNTIAVAEPVGPLAAAATHRRTHSLVAGENDVMATVAEARKAAGDLPNGTAVSRARRRSHHAPAAERARTRRTDHRILGRPPQRLTAVTAPGRPPSWGRWTNPTR